MFANYCNKGSKATQVGIVWHILLESLVSCHIACILILILQEQVPELKCETFKFQNRIGTVIEKVMVPELELEQ